MSAPELVLHVLPPSHPCVAVQAALEIKGLEYELVELGIPFAADMEALYGEGRTTVPGMLVDGERVHGSVAIMERLEELVATPALYPASIADRVTDAVRWSDGLFQDIGRRLPWGALYFRPEAMGTMVAGGTPLNPAGTDAAITLVRQVWKGRGITAVQLAEDLQALPELLDHVDALMADGVVGGEIATAADLLIGSTLDVLRLLGDVRGLIDPRPCARLATDWFDERPGSVPAGAFPTDWVPQPAGMAAPDRLSRYRAKRDPAVTPEPDGGTPAVDGHDGAPRFVIQEHDATRLHWDLRLEHDGVLLSWALPNGVPATPKDNRLAVRTEDHPLAYLDFHGEIPAGQYGAGTMDIYDRGTFEAHKIADDKVEITLHGERVEGRYGLFPLSRDGGSRHEWMIHRMDPPTDGGRERMPADIAPMLARPGPLPSDPAGWAFELKWDGVRALAYGRPGRLLLHSRNRLDITAGYPELRAMRPALGHREVILDGEIVAFDDAGNPSFERLQRRMHVRGDAQVRRLMREIPVVYVVFDLLWLNGRSLMGRTYDERRRELALLDLQSRHWQTPEAVHDGAALLAVTREQGLEGVVAKRRDGRYEPGRRSAGWVKVTNTERVDAAIVGWLPGDGRRGTSLGSLVVAVEEDGRLRYAGRVGTGFTDRELDRLTALLEPLEIDHGAVSDDRIPREVTWVRPDLTAEVSFRHWTQDGVLRAPSYKGLREDADPTPGFLDTGDPVKGGDLVRVGARTLKVTNLEKVLYPGAGFTKRDVIAYLVDIAPVLLGHLERRPLTRKRYPDGVEGKAFFEKQAPSHTPEWVDTVAVPSRRGTVDYVLADELATLVWLGNLAALELHTALHRAERPDTPDTVVFDLDPGAPATIVECCRVALLLEGMLSGLGLQTVAKTSGSKGLQVYLPLNGGEATYDQTRTLARTIAQVLEQAEPDLVVSRMAKTARPGKVLIDWSQNDPHKTTVSVYSLRARDRPTVSTPVTWEEVRACADEGDPQLLVFTAPEVVARVAEQGDLFADARALVQTLPSLS